MSRKESWTFRKAPRPTADDRLMAEKAWTYKQQRRPVLEARGMTADLAHAVAEMEANLLDTKNGGKIPSLAVILRDNRIIACVPVPENVNGNSLCQGLSSIRQGAGGDRAFFGYVSDNGNLTVLHCTPATFTWAACHFTTTEGTITFGDYRVKSGSDTSQ